MEQWQHEDIETKKNAAYKLFKERKNGNVSYKKMEHFSDFGTIQNIYFFPNSTSPSCTLLPDSKTKLLLQIIGHKYSICLM